jgi:hypothetical protein
MLHGVFTGLDGVKCLAALGLLLRWIFAPMTRNCADPQKVRETLGNFCTPLAVLDNLLAFASCRCRAKPSRAWAVLGSG